MKEIVLSPVYRILLENFDRFPEPTADRNELVREITGADAVLARDLELFASRVRSLQEAVKNHEDIEQIRGALVYVRSFAMNISTDFLNLAASIEAVAFTSGG